MCRERGLPTARVLRAGARLRCLAGARRPALERRSSCSTTPAPTPAAPAVRAARPAAPAAGCCCFFFHYYYYYDDDYASCARDRVAALAAPAALAALAARALNGRAARARRPTRRPQGRREVRREAASRAAGRTGAPADAALPCLRHGQAPGEVRRMTQKQGVCVERRVVLVGWDIIIKVFHVRCTAPAPSACACCHT